MEKKEILIISGTGIYGLDVAETIRYLDEKGSFPKNLKLYIGTSAGAVFCFYLAMGLPPSKINNLSFLDPKRTFIDVDHFKIATNFIFNGYFSTTDKLRKAFIEDMKKIFLTESPETFSFLDLYKKTGKILVISALDLQGKRPRYFNIFDTPHVPIVEALLATLGYWPYISPATIDYPLDPSGKEVRRLDFLDGGFFQQYNLDAFYYLEKYLPEMNFCPNNVFGIRVDSPDNQEIVQGSFIPFWAAIQRFRMMLGSTLNANSYYIYPPEYEKSTLRILGYPLVPGRLIVNENKIEKSVSNARLHVDKFLKTC